MSYVLFNGVLGEMFSNARHHDTIAVDALTLYIFGVGQPTPSPYSADHSPAQLS